MKVNVSSIGNPSSPKTWSGTPSNIIEVLKTNNRFGISIEADSDKKLNKIAKYIGALYYNCKTDIGRGKFNRYINARRVVIETKKSSDSVTLHMGTLDLPNNYLTKQRHFLYIDTTWNLWSSHVNNKNNYSQKLRFEAEKLERKSYNSVEHIFSISEYVKQNLIHHYNIQPEKITVVGTGRGVIQPCSSSTKNYTSGKILFAAKGRFEDKGGHLVLSSFKRALEKNPDLHLSIVGQNEYTGKIDHPNISTFGYIEVSELQELFNSHELFLMPALNEPWGLVYLEALSCKMPIMGLNRNSFPELSGYGDHGICIDSLDPEIFANQIIKAFQNPEKLKIMGEKGYKFSTQNFSWQQTTERILSKIGH